jgi:hypothetical protein
MALAMLYPEPGKAGRGKRSEGRAHNLISQARTVLRFAPELARALRDGTITRRPPRRRVTGREGRTQGRVSGRARLSLGVALPRASDVPCAS